MQYKSIKYEFILLSQEEVKQIFDEEKIPVLMNELDKLIDKACDEINSSAW